MKTFFAAAALLCAVALGCSVRAAAAVPDVLVEPAPPGQHATATTYDLAGANYVEREFFISGNARAFDATGLWGVNGAWGAKVRDTRPFKTRILARYPADPAKFNGTVMVEWFNVTSGADLDMEMAYFGEEILRRGYAWVGVTSQTKGVDGLKAGIYAARYGSLNVTDDGCFYDVFSQAAQAIRLHGDQILGGLKPTKLVASGLSQGAQFLVTYANAIHPISKVLDGIVIHGRPASGMGLDNAQVGYLPPLALIRPDIDIPILQFQSEDDVVNLGFALTRQPDTNKIRTWEIAGAAHIDQHLMDYRNTILPRDSGGKPYNCAPLNALPTYRVAGAALRAMDTWMRTGTPPPSTPRISTTLLLAVNRDWNGFSLGGIQQPEYAEPVAKNGQLNLSVDVSKNLTNIFFCIIGGYSTPLTDANIRSRYKSRADYLGRLRAAAQASVQAGTLLPEDVEATVQDAQMRALPLP